MFLDRSAEVRDVENDGSRFWVWDQTGEVEPDQDPHLPFGENTVGIVDENEGGIVAYVHKDNAPRLIEALRAFTGEE